MNRRDFIAAAVTAPVLGGCASLTLEQGLFNECRAATAADLMSSTLVANAWEGLRADRVWDCHAHLFGNGSSNRGIWVNPEFNAGRSPASMARRAFFANAGCLGEDEARWDERMIERLVRLADGLPEGAKIMVMAFDFTHDEAGRRQEALSTFAVENEYAARVARLRPSRFEWIASVHPNRDDAIATLERAKRDGARAVKWLPPAMGIDLASAKSAAFYDALKRLDVPLLVHVGEEQAVAGAARHDLANPLFLRHPLERGVRVIAAHCASLGVSPDLDAASNPAKARAVPNFDLFTRLMTDKRYEGLLFGDISAITQANRAEALPKIVAARAWEGRLLNGSDYPLPGVMPLFSLNGMVASGLLDERVVPALRELRHASPLMFDFVLKRNLRANGMRIPASTFETRPFFDRG